MESFTKTLPRVDHETAKFADEVQAESLIIFRMVHGEGDDGSEAAFFAQNIYLRLGWNCLAAEFLKLKKKKKVKTDEPNSASS